MGLILLFLASLLIVNAKWNTNSYNFFDKSNSNALRGFWSLIVILVHIPLAYQNRVQDMIGSFAYIGVTFFFMTSAYGLMVYADNDRCTIKDFWRRRLLKLLIPCFLTNIVGIIVSLIIGNDFTIITFVKINNWVLWLLICYAFFSVVNMLPIKNGGGQKNIVICCLIIVFSLIMYFDNDLLNIGSWCTEIYGFIYGIILFVTKDRLKNYMSKNWLAKCVLLCLIACILGVGYLKFKPVVFWGDYLLKIVLGFAITLFMLALNVKIKIGNKASSFLGCISFEIYLLHGTVFRLISFWKTDINSGIFIVLSIILTVCISTVVHILGAKIIKLFKI
jgi:peptidoglycan/LPS O-acetylase OafA/YrhL